MRSSNLAALPREFDGGGLIRRRADSDDGRKGRMSPTASGERRAASATFARATFAMRHARRRASKQKRRAT
ncbi:hypothetical protein WS86_28735 [Burkholderia savannae]|nr:hypothetical protein WS86_28735 [Burkholderia savannae]